MEQISRQLRSQLCPNNNAQDPAISVAERDRIVFFGSIASEPTTSGQLTLQRREIAFVQSAGNPNRGDIVERVTPVTATKPAMAYGTQTQRTLANDVARASSGSAFLRYFKYSTTVSPDTVELTAPVPLADREVIMRIDVAFDAFPTGTNESKLKSVFTEQAFVRTADPTDPTRTPRCE
jgi:hypothetical protein